MVEVFNDLANQGQIILGRSAVTNGAWSIPAADVSDLTLNITATYTDPNGNTSPFAVFGPPTQAPAAPTAPTQPAAPQSTQ